MSTLTNPLGQPRWIGYYPGNTDEHIYWEDGSYVEVSSAIYPGMVSWSQGDHSAITTPDEGGGISKWRDMPLMKHRVTDSPYGGYGLKYYIRASIPPSISGPTTVCDQATYSIENLPSGATVEWGVSNSNAATISNNGLLRVTNQTFALTNVEANIFTGGTSFIIRKERVMTGQPEFEIQPLGYSGSNFASFFLAPQGENGDLQNVPLNYRWSYTKADGSGYTLIGYYQNTSFLTSNLLLHSLAPALI